MLYVRLRTKALDSSVTEHSFFSASLNSCGAQLATPPLTTLPARDLSDSYTDTFSYSKGYTSCYWYRNYSYC